MSATQTRTEGHVTVILPSGRLDTDASREFEATVADTLSESKALIMDFSDVTYISSSGLRVILAAAKALMAAGGGFAICSMQSNVLDVFRLAGFNAILPVCDDLAAALDSVGAET